MTALAEIDPQDPEFQTVDEFTCEAEYTSFGERIPCKNPIGFALVEVQDTYDSGHERPEWQEFTIDTDGIKRCGDCSSYYEEHGTDEAVEEVAA